MDVSSEFQDEFDWIIDNVRHEEVSRPQELGMRELCIALQLAPLENGEPVHGTLPGVGESFYCRRDEILADHDVWEPDSSLLNVPTRVAVSGGPSDVVCAANGGSTGGEAARQKRKFAAGDARKKLTPPGIRNGLPIREPKNSLPKSAVAVTGEGQIVFHSDPNAPVRINKRKKFGPERRQEVKVLRRIGACIPCKLRKTTCERETPCTSCATSMQIGGQLCVRDTLLEGRYTDYGSRVLRHARRETSVISTYGCTETVYLCAVGGAGNVPSLEISVTQAQFVESLRNQVDGTRATRQGQGYALAPNALPSKESLVRWAIECGWRTSLYNPVAEKEGKCRLLESAVIFWSLKALLKRCYFILDKPQGAARKICQMGSGDWLMAPKAIHSQLETMLYHLVGEAEQKFLKDLERAVRDLSASTRDKVLALFLSIWILGHTYAFFAAVASAYHDRKESEFFDHMSRLSRAVQKAKFRSSPLGIDWSKTPDCNTIRNDPALIRIIAEIRTWEKGKQAQTIDPKVRRLLTSKPTH
ncbi:MAG: hypothetical protein M1839_003516 [Geoglossum umbratile]|nr:MAG: hypothetical protein M1839_003516 [Geoglossum umbratile]